MQFDLRYHFYQSGATESAADQSSLVLMWGGKHLVTTTIFSRPDNRELPQSSRGVTGPAIMMWLMWRSNNT